MSMQPDSQNKPPTAQTGDGSGSGSSKQDQDWLRRAQKAFEASTNYFDSNFRKEWEDGLRAFNSQHPADSKYNQPAYDKRSRVYRPRIRTVIRKNEAAAAAAFFSNMDVVTADAMDPTDKVECASADLMKQLLQYRLTKSIPWFQVVLGGLQDAQKQQAACAHLYWEFEQEEVEADEHPAMESETHPAQASDEQDEEYPQQGELPAGAMLADKDGGLSETAAPMQQHLEYADATRQRVVKDKPCVDLVPLENVRFDPGASWVDPVNTSPYWIHLMPMYVMDVRDRIDTGEWIEVSDQALSSAREITPDSTRATRQQNRDDPYSSSTRPIGDYEIVWVQRHIHRKEGRDWHFYTIGDQAMLSKVQPLEEVCLHGIRPYVLGVCNLETHKVLPAAIPTLARGLIDETNEIANQRIDNIKFVLNKAYLVRRGQDVDVQGLVRNVPGKVVMVGDPTQDVKEMSWQDVTASSFQEAQGLGTEMDELLGNFNPASLMMNGAGNNPARNMALLGNSQGTLVEYLLRTYVETFVQPLLRQLARLEQAYETDIVVMSLAAKKANIFQKYGINPNLDELLKRELTINVNVGMGATDPTARLNKFMTAMQALSNILQRPPPGLDVKEVMKEVFGHLGYADGSRFFSNQDPNVLMLQQQVQQLQGIIQQLQKKVADKTQANQIAQQKVIAGRDTTIATTQMQEANKRGIAAMKEEGANKRALATHWNALHQQAADHRHQMLVDATRPRPIGVVAR